MSGLYYAVVYERRDRNTREDSRRILEAVHAALPVKSAGQQAYEADCALRPTYHDGSTRRTWAQLRDYEQDTWHRNPTARAP